VHLHRLLQRKALIGPVDHRPRAARRLVEVGTDSSTEGLNETGPRPVGIGSIGRKNLEGATHVKRSHLQSSSEARLAIRHHMRDVPLSRPVLLDSQGPERTTKVPLVLERTKKGTLGTQVKPKQVTSDTALERPTAGGVLGIDDVEVHQAAPTALPRERLQGGEGALKATQSARPRVETVRVLHKQRRAVDITLGSDVGIGALGNGASGPSRRGRRGRRRGIGEHKFRLLGQVVDIDRNRRTGRRERHQKGAKPQGPTTPGNQLGRRARRE
jgi:hypothetical protein